MASTCSPPSGIPRRRERVSDIRFRKQRLLTVWITPLLRKLSEVGLCENLLEWFRSYITDRRKRIYCGNKLSDELPVTHLHQRFAKRHWRMSNVTLCRRHGDLLLWVILPGVDWLAQSRPLSGGKMAKRT